MLEQRVIGTLGDLAAVPGLPSEPTLRKLIRENPDFPIVSTGTNGHAYEIDIAAAIAWLKSHEEKRREAERERSATVQQFALDLLGADAAANVAQPGLSPADRKALYEEEVAAIKLGMLRGEFVRKASVEAAVAAMLDLVSQQYRSLSARLSKRTDLTRRQQTLIDEMVEQDMRQLAAKLEEMGQHGAVPGGDTPV